MFQGSIVALITPFRDGAIDEKAFQSFVEWQIEQGTHGLVPCGTTGESPTLSHDEHMRVTEMCIEAAAGRVPVIAGTGSNSTAEAVALTQHAEKAGADGALLVMPYYNKPTQDGLAAHFRAIHDATDIPLIIYNIPGRSVVNMSIETMIKLTQLPNIVGVKDATGDPSRVSTMRLLVGSGFCQLSGEDAIALSLMAHGAHGCISVTANAAPKLCAEFQNACLAGDFISAREYQDRLMPLHTALFLETSPGPVKHAVSLLDRCADELRLPLVPVGEKIANQIRIVMRACELLD